MVFTSSYPPIDIPTVGVAELLFENRHKIPDTKPILLDAHSDRHITFGQLKRKVLQFAAGLQDKCGFQKGNVLTVFAPNTVSKRQHTTSTLLTTVSF
jgi:acyl-CoA synthetase (AMP-forming)/AMP-acid ligase II